VRVAVQLWLAAMVLPQVVAVMRKGHWLVRRRMVRAVAPVLVRVTVCVAFGPS
jgi:hypothetical protein